MPNYQVKIPTRPVQIPARHAVEPELEESYFRWQQQPVERHATGLLKAVQPVISQEVARFGGGPTLTGKAKLLVLDSLPRYNYESGPLTPFLRKQLHGLARLSAKENQILSVPERVAMGRTQLTEAENYLRDQLGRDPADIEVADHLGLSVKRIAYLRQYKPGFSQGQLANRASEDDDMYDPAVAMDQSRIKAITGMVYDGLDDPIDRAVMEYALGLNGAPRLSVQETARRLNRSPGAISQRAAKLHAQLEQLEQAGVL